MWGLILRGKSVSLDLRISLLSHETSPFHDNILSHVVFVQLLLRQPCCEIIMNEISLSFLREIFFFVLWLFQSFCLFLQCSLSFRYRDYVVLIHWVWAPYDWLFSFYIFLNSILLLFW